MLSGLNKTRTNVLSKLSISKDKLQERQPDVDFAIDLSDNLRLMDSGMTPICTSCTYMLENILDMRQTSVKVGTYRVLSYSICTLAMKPFLLFRLQIRNEKCVLPEVDIKRSGEIPSFDGAEYQGIIENTNVIVYEFKYENSDVNKVTSTDEYILVTIDDIINQRHTFSWKIESSVTNLFIDYEELIYLQDHRGELVETPMSAYRGEYYKMVGVLAGLGVPRSGPYSSLGPYFKFADYARSIRFGVVTLNGKSQYVGDEKITRDDTPVFTRGGLVKYVLFLGNTKVLLNLPTDPDDDSSESIRLAAARPFIKDTLKLRDSAGKWASEYDSIMQPLITIHDSEQNRPRVLDPQVVVKNFKQQHPIQYVYLDTSKVTIDETTGFFNVNESELE
jgi:hypothetical protein